MKKPAFLFSVALSLTLLSLAAQAQEPSNALDQIFASVTEAQPVCFGSEYSSEHLSQHPEQTVERIRAKFNYLAEYNQRVLLLDLTLKNKPHVNYTAVLHCFSATSCAIECDGGNVEVQIQRQSNGEEQLRLINHGIMIEGGCGEDQSEDGSQSEFLPAARSGDDVFLMSRLPNRYCQAQKLF